MSNKIFQSAIIVSLCTSMIGCAQNTRSSSDSFVEEEIVIAPTTNTVVIGGGISGIAAVLRLRQSGVDTILLEKDSSVGGSLLYSCLQQQTLSLSEYDYDDPLWKLFEENLYETMLWQSQDLGMFRIDEEQIPEYVIYEQSIGQLLQSEIEVSGAQVYTETTATMVEEREDGLVVYAQSDDGTVFEIACENVIVASGNEIQEKVDSYYAGVLTNTTDVTELLKQFDVNKENTDVLLSTHFGYVMDEEDFVLDLYEAIYELSEEDLVLVDEKGSLITRESMSRSDLETQMDTDVIYALANEKAYRKLTAYITQDDLYPWRELLKLEEEDSFPNITRGNDLYLACTNSGMEKTEIMNFFGEIYEQFHGADETCYVIEMNRAVYDGVGGVTINENLQIENEHIFVVGSCASAFLIQDPSIGNSTAWAFVSGKYAADQISDAIAE